MNSFINDIFERIATEAGKLATYNKKATLSSREIQTAVRLMLPGELAKHAVSEGTKAVTNIITMQHRQQAQETHALIPPVQQHLSILDDDDDDDDDEETNDVGDGGSSYYYDSTSDDQQGQQHSNNGHGKLHAAHVPIWNLQYWRRYYCCRRRRRRRNIHRNRHDWWVGSLLVLVALLLLLGAVWFLHGRHVVSGPVVGNTTTTNLTGPYVLTQKQTPSNWLDFYDFYDGPDSIGSNGYNTYVSKPKAQEMGLFTQNGETSLILQSKPLPPSTPMSSTSSSTKEDYYPDGFRASLRLESKQVYNGGLFVMRVSHVPSGCGVWPAFWMTDKDVWPDHGEIDIIEGINTQSTVKTALHTSEDCSMYAHVPAWALSGTWDVATGLPDTFTGIPNTVNRVQADNCYVLAPHQWANQGCVLASSDNTTLGDPINQQGGATYVLEWDPLVNKAIRSWVFPASRPLPDNLQQVLEDEVDGTTVIDPTTWPVPYAYFAIGEYTGCSADHFQDMNLIINLAFCGTVAGNRFFHDCPALAQKYNVQNDSVATCNAYLQDMAATGGLEEAFWELDSLHIFQRTEWIVMLKSFVVGFCFWSASVQQSAMGFAPGLFLPAKRMSTLLEAEKKRVVVVGNGMVGQRFMENLVDEVGKDGVQITTFCEEPLAAYNRVKLTSYFETRNPSDLSMTSEFKEDGTTSWYDENGVEILMNDKVVSIDTKAKTVTGASGKTIPYDACVMATGSYPFVPPIPGKQRPGVFVYRTIDDLEAMLAYAKENNVKSAAVIGGGLLGLEAAKAVMDMGVTSHIIEFADFLMCRQIDKGGHNALAAKIEDMGLHVHCGARTQSFVGEDGTTDNDSASPVSAIRFNNEGWDDLPVQMIVVSAGIKPRDELARDAEGLEIGERGGIKVDDQLRTTAENVYAVGEIALHKNFIYGLVAPGYEMTEVCAKVVADDLKLKPIEGETPAFTGADLSTKLKLLGCDVASFGVNQPKPDDTDVQELIWNDPFLGIYRKLIFNKAGTKLRGGILVGDAGDYGKLLKLALGGVELDEDTSPAKLLPPASAKSAAAEGPADDVQICSCNDVMQSEIAEAIMELGVDGATLPAVKKASRAATNCGGCEAQVKDVLKTTLEAMGGAVDNSLCEHMPYSRSELVAKIRVESDPTSVDTFEKIIAKYGKGDGCELCKPAVGSILASLNNEVIIGGQRAQLQDTNDRAMANMQRGGTYSVVPRVPGGELTPDQLIAMGEVANKYNLYTKITGGQRVDLFGAAKHELPDIWEELGKAGFESGHAYGKALRTVKSCVGSTWCRYGMQDSVGFAVEIENRYKGIRSPHKMKSGVSGCARECAEAKGKDFGLIATENGYNLYFGGNGGTNPVHAELFASDIDEATCLKYIDRYLMYYILTAEKLERIAPWHKKLPSGKNGGGPIEYLKEVIIEDSLGICDELDKRMQHLIDTYHDEWAEVYNNPELRAQFKQFANTDKNINKEDMLEFIDQRGMTRPADWPKDGEEQTNWEAPSQDVFANSEKSWVEVGKVSDFVANVGTPILYGDTQLAVFNNVARGEWYCTQNMCPHKQAFVLSQGIIGATADNAPKVACPLHKKQFNLKTGEGVGEEPLNILTFPVKVDGEKVMVELPSEPELDAILGTNGLRVRKSSCVDIAEDALKVPSKKASSSAAASA
eukprot:Nitzschia sp. Nitz4//scaffold313_size41840//10902//17056//NITZ4_007432-RA/size41840-processed-gene-0.86-mRNA-1//-1//CDS//3329547418//241//frame0